MLISLLVWFPFLLQTPNLQNAPSPLPQWVALADEPGAVSFIQIPSDLKKPAPTDISALRCLILTLDPSWQPDWQNAAFDIKGLIVNWKTRGPDVQVGIQATPDQINALLEFELAPYIDGYLYRDEPWLPEADSTGKLWLLSQTREAEVLSTLLDASDLGVEWVFLQDVNLHADTQALLKTLAVLPTGSIEPSSFTSNIEESLVHFFYNPSAGDSHLAFFAEPGQHVFLTLRTDSAMKTTALVPENLEFDAKNYGDSKLELSFEAQQRAYLFHLVPDKRTGLAETLQIVEKKTIDPYELVVKNQVFKDAEGQKLESLIVDEEVNYRYQGPNGAIVDVTFMDTVYRRKGQPTERVRRELYIGGVKWPYKDQPELPLIQPEKVQQEPLEIDLNKSYRYTYAGEDVIDGHKTWQVNFKPAEAGNLSSGSVWIDQESGAHRRLRAIQSGLQPPVTGNEMNAFFDWVEVEGKRYWTQVREANLLTLNVVGERVALQLDIRREHYRFNDPQVETALEQAYKSDVLILRDTAKGFRYLSKKGGERVINDEPVTRKKLLLGGVLLDPSLDYPTPLGGINYTDLDFLGKGYQANLFLAGVLNVATVSNTNLFGKGWDLTGEIFATALYFGDTVYEGTERRDDLEVQSLREAGNITLGIPLNNYLKATLNYSLRYLAFKKGDELREDYIIPNDTLEHIGRIGLSFDRRKFSTAVQYETVSRTDWEPFGLQDDLEPFYDSYRHLQIDMAFSHRLPKFQSIGIDARYLKGWDLDRFSKFGFGFFENSVSGFGTSGVEGDEAVRLRFSYDVGVKGLFQLNTSLDGARAWNENQLEPVDIAGIGLAANFVGPWKMLMRINVGYGLYSSLDGEDGDWSGQILFLRLY